MDIQTYILSKRYTDESLSGAGALSGKSAYEIAVLNGFSGNEKQWLESLQGKTPEIGPDGTWIIDGQNTGIVASPDLANYMTKDYINTILAKYYTKIEIDNLAMNGIDIQPLSKEEIEEITKKGE